VSASVASWSWSFVGSGFVTMVSVITQLWQNRGLPHAQTPPLAKPLGEGIASGAAGTWPAGGRPGRQGSNERATQFAKAAKACLDEARVPLPCPEDLIHDFTDSRLHAPKWKPSEGAGEAPPVTGTTYLHPPSHWAAQIG